MPNHRGSLEREALHLSDAPPRPVSRMSEESGSSTSSTTSPAPLRFPDPDDLSSFTKDTADLIIPDNNNTKTSEEATLGNLPSSTLDESPTTAPDLSVADLDLNTESTTLSHSPGTPSSTNRHTPSNGPKTPHKSVRVHKSDERIISEAHLLNQVQKLCRLVDLELAEVAYEKYLPASHAVAVAARVREGLGFSLELRPSEMEGGGTGVFVGSGHVPAKHLVGIYPGTVYKAGDTVLIQSLANPFVFQCLDGSLIDGSNRSLSRMIYSFRDRYGSHLMSDLTWLNPAKANPLSVGQFVNNQSPERAANVAYQEADLPLAHFLPNLRRYLPNCLYNSTILGEDEENPRMRVVLLVSLRDIGEGEELLSSYFTLIT